MGCKIKIFAVSEKLDKVKISSDSKCYLVGMNLKEYLENLPNDYTEYDIQRGIVKNTYLDSIAVDVIKGAHLPIITLTASSVSSENIESYKILDGLQRTFRIHQLYNFLKRISGIEDFFEISEDRAEFRKKYREEWRLNEEFTFSVLEVRKIIQALKDCRPELIPNKLLDIFQREQWFEIWENLSPDDEIRKMIVLNAGHKPMDNYHQLELLFLNQLSYIRDKFPDIEIIRGKDMSPLQYGKTRKEKQFYFAHVIEVMLSYIDKKPVTLNSSLIQAVQNGETATLPIQSENNIVVDTIQFLMDLDSLLKDNYGDIGTKWIAKDTVLTAIVATISQRNKTFSEFMVLLKENSNSLNIELFNRWRSSLDISKVNIGKYTKDAVMTGISEFIYNPKSQIEWGRNLGGENG